jgi:hypothetical protein
MEVGNITGSRYSEVEEHGVVAWARRHLKA